MVPKNERWIMYRSVNFSFTVVIAQQYISPLLKHRDRTNPVDIILFPNLSDSLAILHHTVCW